MRSYRDNLRNNQNNDKSSTSLSQTVQNQLIVCTDKNVLAENYY